MKRKVLSGLLAALALAVGITSCSEDNQYEYTTSNECIITSMTMGGLKRCMHTQNSKGEDSTFYVTVTGAYYPMTIDHLQQRIYNVDSLPVGTDVEHVVFAGLNSIGTYSILSLENGRDTIFNLNDSTDFRTPRMVRVHATDGVSKRLYQVSINVHQEEGDSMNWQRTTTGNAVFATMHETKGIFANNKQYVFGKKEGISQVAVTDDPTTGNWSLTNTSAPIDPQSVIAFQNQLYAVDAQGQLHSSVNATKWDIITTDFTPGTLIVGGEKIMVALKDGKFYSSEDGKVWNLDETDEPDQMPLTQAVGIRIPSKIDRNFETFVVVGNRDGKNVVWKREIDLTGNETFPWVYLPETLGSNFNIPNLNTLSLNLYDSSILLAGLKENGQLAPLYLSKDFGRTWKTNGLKTPAANAQNAIAVNVDDHQFIWMYCGTSGDVWRGRINRLGWDEDDGIFERAIHL